jgi:FkbM family methyltransferase
MFARPFVGTVHDRLNVVDRQFELVHAHLNRLSDQFSDLIARLGELNERTDHLAGAQGALLQGSIRAIELLQELQLSYQDQSSKWDSIGRAQQASLASIKDQMAPWELRLASLQEQGIASAALQKWTAESSQNLSDAITELEHHTKSVLQNQVVRQVCVETDDYEFTDPETGLMAFLFSYLPTRKALDIGANVGDVSERLLRAGYEVFAFEPLPDVYERLVQRLGEQKAFHPFQLAVGSNEVEMPLHTAIDNSGRRLYGDATLFASLTAHSMPDDLPFTSTIVVKVNTLKNLHQAGIVPEDISLVKIDTEGFDLEVIRGMGDHRYPVVGAEFWDREIPFGRSGLLYTLDSLVGEMRKLGYAWHIVLYRIWGENHTGYYGNHARAVPHSWGNVVFFRDYALFAQAQAWCAAVLPRTYFKPKPAS